MEPVRRPEPPAGPEWTAEVKWDGVRCLALVEGSRVRLWSRRGRERTEQFPELQALAGQLRARQALLDGELVVLRADGRPSFPGILERDLAVGPAEARRRAARQPALLVAFDLLAADGEEYLQNPLATRQERLRAILTPGPAAIPIESFPDGGPALFQAACQQELEGVVCKRLDSPYRPGEKSPLWVKVKRRLQMLCLVGGYTVTGGRPGAVLLGAHDAEGRLRYLGRAGSGLKEEELSALAAALPPAPCPFDPVPRVEADRWARRPDRVVWVRPILGVQVEFLEWTEEGRLRSPVVKGFAPVDPGAVRLE
ncbi:MAG: non-homologous end-joining DNA ligase [Firmicutes bacterium]|nr:non-homologous end-joining DNA ligase [Bacillota bacterium]